MTAHVVGNEFIVAVEGARRMFASAIDLFHALFPSYLYNLPDTEQAHTHTVHTTLHP